MLRRFYSWAMRSVNPIYIPSLLKVIALIWIISGGIFLLVLPAKDGSILSLVFLSWAGITYALARVVQVEMDLQLIKELSSSPK